MIDLVISCSKFVLDLFSKIKITNDEKKKKISESLVQISALIFKVIESLENNEYPHGACETMQILSRNLGELLDGEIDDSLLEELERSLIEATEFERLYAERGKESLIELEKAAGRFDAAAIMIKL